MPCLIPDPAPVSVCPSSTLVFDSFLSLFLAELTGFLEFNPFFCAKVKLRVEVYLRLEFQFLLVLENDFLWFKHRISSCFTHFHFIHFFAMKCLLAKFLIFRQTQPLNDLPPPLQCHCSGAVMWFYCCSNISALCDCGCFPCFRGRAADGRRFVALSSWIGRSLNQQAHPHVRCPQMHNCLCSAK